MAEDEDFFDSESPSQSRLPAHPRVRSGVPVHAADEKRRAFKIAWPTRSLPAAVREVTEWVAHDFVFERIIMDAFAFTGASLSATSHDKVLFSHRQFGYDRSTHAYSIYPLAHRRLGAEALLAARGGPADDPWDIATDDAVDVESRIAALTRLRDDGDDRLRTLIHEGLRGYASSVRWLAALVHASEHERPIDDGAQQELVPSLWRHSIVPDTPRFSTAEAAVPCRAHWSGLPP
jgi:hypothetical protein